MKKYNVLVTGVGAIIGYGIIQSLRKANPNLNIIGIDCFSDAVGQFWCDKFIQGRLASSNEFIPFLENLIISEKIDIIFPAIDPDVKVINENYKSLSKLCKVVLNSSNLIEKTADKYIFYKDLLKNNIEAIPSYIGSSFETAVDLLRLPMLLKPRRSSGSKGIRIIEDEIDFNYWHKKLGDMFMVQRIIGDAEHEYTAAVFGYGNGKCSKSIIFQRKLSREGATSKAWLINDKKIINSVDKEINIFVKEYKPVGPTNFQFRLHENKYYLLEINPRISSSTSIRTACGYNEAEMCINYFLMGNTTKFTLRGELSAFRYIQDYII